MAFDRERMKMKAADLAAKGVFIGTSSWKYDGWFGQLYTPARYEYRGKVAKARFERACLTEYAEVFKTVCVDAAYYSFPRREYLQGLADQVPSDIPRSKHYLIGGFGWPATNWTGSDQWLH